MGIATNFAAYMNGRIRGHYVYFLVCGDPSRVFIKIGHTHDPISRLSGIRTGCPLPPDTMGLIHVFSREAAIKLEKALHVKMNNWHSHGEWIALNHKDRAEFQIKCYTVLKEHSRRLWPLKITAIDVKSVPERMGLQKVAPLSENLYIGRQRQKVSV